MTDSVRIAGLDSGKQRDQSCLVSLNVDVEMHTAFVEGCKFWPRRTEYSQIEADVARYHTRKPWKRIMCEVNNVGEHVYESMLRNWGLPVRPVTTVAKLSGDRMNKPKPQRLRRSMPKNEMVTYYIKLKMRHAVLWPANPDANIKQLLKQMSAFAEHKTDAGNVRYSAPGTEHDDGVMALLMALFEARPLLDAGRASHVMGPAYAPAIDRELEMVQYV